MIETKQDLFKQLASRGLLIAQPPAPYFWYTSSDMCFAFDENKIYVFKVAEDMELKVGAWKPKRAGTWYHITLDKFLELSQDMNLKRELMYHVDLFVRKPIKER